MGKGAAGGDGAVRVALGRGERIDQRMFDTLRARTRAVAARRRNAGGAKAARGKAAVTFAARLTFEEVSRRYGEGLAVDRVSLDIEPGEIVCLLGPSGCGKTTLLRVAAGVERPSGGRVLIDDQEVAGPNRFVPPEKRGVGLMFQDFALFPHLSILDNVAFGLNFLTRSEAKAEAFAALQRVGLGHYAGEYPHILSGGEQQRVALARAIAPRPGVLLMDEPFSGLDPRLRETMREETLAILHETRATAIVVTHDAEEAMRMGDRVALMRKGRIVQAGNAIELYRAPKDIFAARTFSDLNELPARIEGGRAATPLGTFAANGLAEGADAIVCVRQRGVQLLAPGQGVPGRVLDMRFLGDVGLVEVAVQGLDAPLLARVKESDVPRQGAEVGVGVDAGAVLIFECQENSGGRLLDSVAGEAEGDD
jgi:iron(III) transport system ATP-binding protein